MTTKRRGRPVSVNPRTYTLKVRLTESERQKTKAIGGAKGVRKAIELAYLELKCKTN